MQTSVILYSFINKLRLEGRDIPTATLDASLLRLRPIMMTALVACFGLLPAASLYRYRERFAASLRDRDRRRFGVAAPLVDISLARLVCAGRSRRRRFEGVTMIPRFICRAAAATLVAWSLTGSATAQQPRAWTWPEIKDKFEATNPSLLAGKLTIDESRSDEITAFLRPNPSFSVLADQIELFTPNPYQPLTNLFSSFSASYLHERRNKRELRLDSAKKGTEIAQSQQSDLERNLLFTLRNAFVQTLQAKAVFQLVTDNLAYYDHVLEVSRVRFHAGDIAQIDLDRLELQRVQFETDLQNATVALRNAKIQLLMLLIDRTPVEQFDVAGTFDFRDEPMSLDQFRTMALNTRPDLRSAMQAVEKAKVDHTLAVANGSTDPIFGVDTGRNPPLNWYLGFNVTIPLRFFDKNQGEKQRTQIDIARNERLRDRR